MPIRGASERKRVAETGGSRFFARLVAYACPVHRRIAPLRANRVAHSFVGALLISLARLRVSEGDAILVNVPGFSPLRRLL